MMIKAHQGVCQVSAQLWCTESAEMLLEISNVVAPAQHEPALHD